MSQTQVKPFSKDNPVLPQSPDLEEKIKEALGTLGEYFHLIRYLIWPEYRMPVYYYIVGLYEVQIERHTSYWAFIFKSQKGFRAATFVDLSKRRHAFIGLGRKGGDYHTTTHCLEVHVDGEKELLDFVRATLPLMEWKRPQ